MANKREQKVIDEARLAMLGWLGCGVDGGRAMLQSMARLRIAFEDLDDEAHRKKRRAAAEGGRR